MNFFTEVIESVKLVGLETVAVAIIFVLYLESNRAERKKHIEITRNEKERNNALINDLIESNKSRDAIIMDIVSKYEVAMNKIIERLSAIESKLDQKK